MKELTGARCSVEIPLGSQSDVGTQPRYEAPGGLLVEN